MKIGLLGGSFDPPHNAHIAVAQAVRKARGLDRVDLLVSGQSPHAGGKSNHADVQHRLAMAHLAVEGQEGLGVEDWETRREGRSYSIETIRALQKAHPQNNYDFIIGGDMLADLPTWREIDKLLVLVDFVPVFRPGYEEGVFEDLRGKLGEDETARLRANVVEMPLQNISSTEIRAAAAAGESIAEWVPPAVRTYIRGHHLYERQL
ncbi:MAG: nicotinate (nicotinamide) nucleotide adenylyltransferase [Planctomycetes bacterium]|nr:nicotinate (nicotinamide) nucleotide adenylyltransferase [Planctomycetota bacterium]